MSTTLGGTPDRPVRSVIPEIDAAVGMRVLHRGSRTVGVVTKVIADGVAVRTAAGERNFRFHPGAFIVDGTIVTLRQGRRPAPGPRAPVRSASGSVLAPDAGRPKSARVARASRIWVEGIHDAELLERVWGDDLRDLGIVVERLDGIDNALDRIAAFAPGPERRLGLLVDHLVAGSKERRLADEIERRHAPFVTVAGIPFIDVWQAVRPQALGLAAWPVVPRGEDWKSGICLRLGVRDAAGFWRRLLAQVRDYTVLEPPLIAAVESLLDELASGTEPSPGDA